MIPEMPYLSHVTSGSARVTADLADAGMSGSGAAPTGLC